MSHIAVDLKVIEVKAPAVARAAGVDPDRVLAGLVRLWHRCWSCKSDTLNPIELAGIFGTDRIDSITNALLAFDLLADAEDLGWRVRGADRYLRIQAGRSKGGKSASGNLKRGKKSPAALRLTPGSPPADSRLVSGLSPSTEHRAPNTEQKTLAGELPPAKESGEHQAIIDSLVATFEADTGTKYRFDARDAKAVKELRGIADRPEIETRWRRARRLTHPPVDNIWQLPKAWNRCARDGPVSGSSKGPIDAGTQSHTQTGWVTDF